MDAIVQIGCIACLVTGISGTPGAVHHMLRGGRRMGHLFTLCLCDPGHHKMPPADSGKIPRHPFKRRFETAYGSEHKLLELTRQLVNRSVK